MRVLRIGVASYADVKARTLAIARGEYKRSENEPKLWVTSLDSIAKVLSGSNQELLRLIAERRPKSLTELARLTGRKVPNLSRTLHTMEEYGIVKLDKQERGELVPETLYDRVEFGVDLAHS